MGQSLTRPVPLRSTTELLTGKSNLDSALQVRIRHVLLPTEDEAQSILGEVSTVNTNPSRALAKWAETHSRCPSGTSGGDLGWVRPGSLVAELEEAVTSIPVGRPSLLKSRFGWHVLLKEDVANVGIALSNVSNEGGDDVHESLKALSGAISSSPWKGPPIVPDGLERSQNKKLPKRQVQEPEAVIASELGKLNEDDLLAMFRMVILSNSEARDVYREVSSRIGIPEESVRSISSFYRPVRRLE